MNPNKIQRGIVLLIVGVCVGIPLIVAIKSPGVGGVFLLLGVFIAYRALRFLAYDHSAANTKINRSDSAGKTILVQIVDDFGRELPPNEVEKRLTQAQAKAGPRDSVVPVRFKVNQEDNSSGEK